MLKKILWLCFLLPLLGKAAVVQTTALITTSNSLVAQIRAAQTNIPGNVAIGGNVSIAGNATVAGVLRGSNSATLDGGVTVGPLTASLFLGTNWQWLSDSFVANRDLRLFDSWNLTTPLTIGTNGILTLSSGLSLPTGAGAGKVWTSDANGLGTWTGLGTAANSNASAFVASSAGLGTNNSFYSPTNTPQASNQVAQTVQGLAGQTNHLTRWEFPAGTLVSAVKSNGCVLLPNGTTNFPAIGWLSDDDGTGTGFFRSAANTVSFANNGVNTVNITSSGLSIRGGTIAMLPSDLSTTGTMGYSSGFFMKPGSSNYGITNLFYSSLGFENSVEYGFDGGNTRAFIRSIGVVSAAVPLAIGISNAPQVTFDSAIVTINAGNKLQIGPSKGSSTVYGNVGGTYSVQTSPVSNTGASQTNLLTLSIPAAALTNNGDRLTFSASGKFVANGDAKELLVLFGSETVFDSTSQVVNGGAWVITGEIIRTGNTAQSAWVSYNGAGLSLFTVSAAASLSQTNGIATLLAIAGTATSNDITNRTLTVHYWPSP